jgi:hypothetical protein
MTRILTLVIVTNPPALAGGCLVFRCLNPRRLRLLLLCQFDGMNISHFTIAWRQHVLKCRTGFQRFAWLIWEVVFASVIWHDASTACMFAITLFPFSGPASVCWASSGYPLPIRVHRPDAHFSCLFDRMKITLQQYAANTSYLSVHEPLILEISFVQREKSLTAIRLSMLPLLDFL